MDKSPVNIVLFIMAIASLAEGTADYFQSHDIGLASIPWPSSQSLNATLSQASVAGCNFCGDAFYHEPPPDDIMFIPAPPLHPNFFDGQSETLSTVGKRQINNECDFCNFFSTQEDLFMGSEGSQHNAVSRIISILMAFIGITGALCCGIFITRRKKIINSISSAKFLNTNQAQLNNVRQINKNGSLNDTLSNTGVHLSDPCYLQTNRDKNLTSPIISEHATHKKTSIPSKYWAQPGIINHSVRRIPNEYEIPSSRTESTGTSSALYSDMNHHDNAQRFFSPYNVHTYAEVREIIDANDNLRTSSNSSVMLSESNYDNSAYPQVANCVVNNGNFVAGTTNGSVQMSDFNPIRSVNQINHGPSQPPMPNQIQTSRQLNHNLNQVKITHNAINVGQPIYEQPPLRAQIIITSNNQGINPTLLNFKDQIHNVI